MTASGTMYGPGYFLSDILFLRTASNECPKGSLPAIVSAWFTPPAGAQIWPQAALRGRQRPLSSLRKISAKFISN